MIWAFACILTTAGNIAWLILRPPPMWVTAFLVVLSFSLACIFVWRDGTKWEREG